MAMVNCCVIGLSGQSLELEMPQESKVADLKTAIEDSWAVPQMCQKLLCGGRMVSDVCRCKALPENELQLVVSTETLHIALQSAFAPQALEQLQKCAKRCDQGDHAVWSAVEVEVWDCLQALPLAASEEGVANAAAAVLVAAALAKRPKTLEEALARLEGSSAYTAYTRLVCVKVLTAIGDSKHLYHLRGRLEDMCHSVRAEAIKGIVCLAPLDQGLLCAISSHLHDVNVLVRQASVEAIGSFVSASGCTGCSSLVQDCSEPQNFHNNLEFVGMVILSRLQHPQVSVRSFVAAAVAKAVACAGAEFCLSCGKPRCLKARQEKAWAAQAAQLLVPCLLDAAAAVQGVALQVIATLPGEDGKLTSPELLALRKQVFPCLSHADAGVRITASRAITKLASFGDREVAAALRDLAKRDTDISVRTAAKNALPFMGEDPF